MFWLKNKKNIALLRTLHPVITFANVDPDQTQLNVGPDLNPI